MKRKPLPRIRESTVNVTPLIDVVMCLIIFFMLVARIGIATGAEPMDLPASIAGLPIKDMGNTITLNVRVEPGQPHPTVSTMVAGQRRVVPLVDEQNQQPLSVLLRQLRTANPNLKVIIRADRGMAYEHLEPVLLACAHASVRNVNFNTRIAAPE